MNISQKIFSKSIDCIRQEKFLDYVAKILSLWKINLIVIIIPLLVWEISFPSLIHVEQFISPGKVLGTWRGTDLMESIQIKSQF